ncbi:MAG: hypothetical protein KGK01_02770 [Bradyrhizobium sp.]|uniref:hypothetical protein n=1 Tax=Bradyrhizobium sp. TaxID=376 RepID=UPI001C28FF69|nr:hypothetical protein [Bradyrhizobium sp.]MBU6461629.1 hypothetical protein [Pseudomonadota bacterium]MDE2067536.1 hypothetical protein [Bradyrhizobium sp.]MDE2241384.1 hypothetical protein [Bradyrhizobium sp.]MDE2472433.1 hypothetical protein [Bradyrhizobium sp.]
MHDLMWTTSALKEEAEVAFLDPDQILIAATAYFLSKTPSLRAMRLTEPVCLSSRSDISAAPAL